MSLTACHSDSNAVSSKDHTAVASAVNSSIPISPEVELQKQSGLSQYQLESLKTIAVCQTIHNWNGVQSYNKSVYLHSYYNILQKIRVLTLVY